MNKLFRPTLVAAALALAGLSAHAADLPGKGISVLPLKSSIAEETFQTLLVMKALEQLGYEVQPIKEVEYPTAHVAIGNGDATFLADHWNPLHADYFKNAGGEAKLFRKGIYSGNAAQGYLIDKKTADQYKITHIDQLKDPAIAKIFDNDGDGKADLTGCNPGWGCEAVIEHHLDAYQLRGTVTHQQGSYSALMADTITRFKAGQPVLYLHLDALLGEQRAQARQGCGLAGGAFLLAARRAKRAGHQAAQRQKLRLCGEQPANRGQQSLGREKPSGRHAV